MYHTNISEQVKPGVRKHSVCLLKYQEPTKQIYSKRNQSNSDLFEKGTLNGQRQEGTFRSVILCSTH